jgi:cell wall-associated NlpC family hydrolase
MFATMTGMTAPFRRHRVLSMLVVALTSVGVVVGSHAEAAAKAMTPAVPAATALADLRFVPVMQAAGSMLGTPYRWGGSSPGGFDCSGLVQWSFAQGGIGLPRDSRSQRAATTPISEWELQPGDLVFYGSPVYHVGIYMGDGQMIHSPRTGDVVKISPVHRSGMEPSSFGRVK